MVEVGDLRGTTCFGYFGSQGDFQVREIVYAAKDAADFALTLKYKSLSHLN